MDEEKLTNDRRFFEGEFFRIRCDCQISFLRKGNVKEMINSSSVTFRVMRGYFIYAFVILNQ